MVTSTFHLLREDLPRRMENAIQNLEKLAVSYPGMADRLQKKASAVKYLQRHTRGDIRGLTSISAGLDLLAKVQRLAAENDLDREGTELVTGYIQEYIR